MRPELGAAAFGERVARIRLWTRRGLAVMRLRSAHVFRTAELQHPVEGLDGNGDLGFPAHLRAGSKRVADHPLVSADIGLRPTAARGSEPRSRSWPSATMSRARRYPGFEAERTKALKFTIAEVRPKRAPP